MIIDTASDLLRSLAAGNSVVFGTGYVAEMLREAVRRHGEPWRRVRRCVVSCPKPGEHFHGVPVEGMDWLEEQAGAGEESPMVVVAVHEAVLPEVAAQLDAIDANWVWAYPYLQELLWGPVLEQRRVPVRDLVMAQGEGHYWLAVRELVLSEPELGEPAYLKAQALHCLPATARNRLDAFKALEASFMESGFDEEHPLLVDEDLGVIDGLHRLVLAWHLGLYDVPCKVVAPSDTFARLVGEDNRMSEKVLAKAQLTESELTAVRRTYDRMRSADPLVSIILPAYNVEGYLDECLETVVAQTMGDFEAILVNDGSTDGTLERCGLWAARDARVRVIDQPNGGVSAARNTGIEAARGRWLAFVDPDDWLELDYLEAMLREAARTGADRVECDLWRYDGRSGKETMRSCGGRMGVPFTREEQMRYGPTASYKAISRAELWQTVRFPDCPYESPAVYALVVALARKLAHVPRPLYHYRRFRPNSLVETAYATNGGSQSAPLGVEAMEELVRGFEAHGLLDRYAQVLRGVVCYRLSDMLAMYHHRMGAAAFDELCQSYHELVARLFGEDAAAGYLMLGGYNLNRLLLDLDLLQDPRLRLNFSSVIALVDEPCTAGVTHANRYRELMLTREFDRAIWQLLANWQPRYLFWDLVEERHDVGIVDGRYVTLSDAFEGSSLAGCESVRIARGTDECRELWERSADAFVARVHEVSPSTRIVVVETYLAETVGSLDGQREHEGAEAIRATNKLLSTYYAYLREQHPTLTYVDTHDVPSYFTDEHHEYGVVPEHLNAIANGRIAHLIGEAIS